jgi:hypothetical protein
MFSRFDMHNFKQHKMSLQQLAICTHLDNILMDRQVQLTDLEQEFKAEFKKVADAALFPTANSCSTHNQYKMAYSLYFLAFYKILKLVLAEYSLIAPDCENIKFQDVPAIMQVINNFDTNYHRMCRPHTNPIPTL